MKILLSIHPTHIEKIKNQTKKFELRTIVAKHFNENQIIVYATRPISKVVGIIFIKQTHINTPDHIWDLTKELSCVSKAFYDRYYQNKKQAVAYEIEKYLEFVQAKELVEFGIKHPPQSFIYIK